MEVRARAVRGSGLVKNVDLAHLDTAGLGDAERVLGGEDAGAPTDEDPAGSLCTTVSVYLNSCQTGQRSCSPRTKIETGRSAAILMRVERLDE